MAQNLAAKYRPTNWDDVTEQGVVVDIFKNIFESSDDISVRNFLLVGPAGCGKAQPLDSKLLTPTGYVLMKDIKLGDVVFTSKGNVGTVSNIFPQGVRKIYRIRLSDNTSIRVSDNHLNCVRYRDKRSDDYKDVVLSTDDLKYSFEQNQVKYEVESPFVDWSEQDVPIDTYLYGLLLGRYHFKTNEIRFTDDEYDMEGWFKSLLKDYGVSTCEIFRRGRRYLRMCPDEDKNDYSEFLHKIEDLNLNRSFQDRFIDPRYIYNSKDARLTVLTGLLDSNGHINDVGSISISITGKLFSEQVEFLIRSLGIYDKVTEKTSKSGNILYVHRISPPTDMYVTSIEKYSYYMNDRDKKQARKIVSIEYEGEEECQCIYIDHEDHTYISDGFIPTHNTTLARLAARRLNGSSSSVIEIDAASHGNVDEIQKLVDQMHQYPVGEKWKVFILDECFHRDTNVRLASGIKHISDVNVGDFVYTMQGMSKVLHKFSNKVSKDNLVLLNVGDSTILTTKQHLFFTNHGWVACQDLKPGDLLYDYKSMRNVWKGISDYRENSERLQEEVHINYDGLESEEISKLESYGIYKDVSDMWEDLIYRSSGELKNLFLQVRSRIQEATRTYTEAEKIYCFAQAGIYLYNMWESHEHCQIGSLLDILRGMCEQVSELDEGSKYYVQSRSDEENDVYETEECNLAQFACSTWKEWYLHIDSKFTKGQIPKNSDIIISCKNDKDQSEKNELSYELQTRPCLLRFNEESIGGWVEPSSEVAICLRFEEINSSKVITVEGIEVYKSGYNDELFRSYFSNSELSSDYVTMYDLEVEGHPSYFVDDVLVHNCHSVTNQAWQKLLATLESQPAKSILFMCTTNPEKIPNTILSRVQTFRLSKISLSGIYSRLLHIIQCENESGGNIKYEEDAIQYIAKLANGGLRDSITLLDKSLSYTKNLTSENVLKALNVPDYDDYFNLLNYYAKKDNEGVAECIDKVYNSGINFVKWFEEFHSFVMNIVKYILLQDITKTMIPSQYSDKISKYSSKHTIVCLKLANKLLQMNSELKTTQYQQEVALTYLCSIPEYNK